MSSVGAQAYGPDELLAAEADFRLWLVGLPLMVGGAERRRDRHGCSCDALVRGREVLGESFQVDRRAAEQQLDVEGGRAAAADAVESMVVLQLGDHALGVCHPPPVGPDAGVA